MTMQLKVVHTTGFEYDAQTTASYNEARLTPQTSPGQIVVHSRVDVTPSPWIYTYRDYWGTEVTAFEVLDAHDQLTVTGTSTVHTDRPAPGEDVLGWEAMRSEAVADAHTEHLGVDERVAPPYDLAEQATRIAGSAATPSAAARELCALVHREVSYLSGSTDVEDEASVAWEARSGVCQDMAHLVIGCLRSVGIPARYVSGYLHPHSEPAVGEAVAGESHAWVEWWDEGWRGFDPTNDTVPGDRHVVVATGRDYADVRPLGGIYAGEAASTMFVSVEVTRLA